MVSKEQKRSAFALKKIEQLGGSISKDMANFIVGTPTMILQNGFGQTMAFLLSKNKDKKDKHGFVFDVIQNWAVRENPEVARNDDLAFLSSISKMDQDLYMNLQEETLMLLQWLKRYARAFQEDKQEG
jgi:CRISPR-associated protein Cmr5